MRSFKERVWTETRISLKTETQGFSISVWGSAHQKIKFARKVTPQKLKKYSKEEWLVPVLLAACRSGKSRKEKVLLNLTIEILDSLEYLQVLFVVYVITPRKKIKSETMNELEQNLWDWQYLRIQQRQRILQSRLSRWDQ